MKNAQKHDFSSLSIKDLLDAREAYHVHLAHLDAVYATAIGRYLIRKKDRNAKDPKHHSKPETLGPRTLFNSVVKEWSWPCVLVFVKRWFKRSDIHKTPSLASELVPAFLYLSDGRVVPTCVVEVDPEKGAPAAVDPPLFKSDLVAAAFPFRPKPRARFTGDRSGVW